MSTPLIALFPGLLVGLGVAVLVLTFAPKSIQATDALGRLGQGSMFEDEIAVATTRDERIGGWIHRHIPNIPILLPPVKQLDLLEVPISTFYAKKLIYAIIGALAPLLMSVGFGILGYPVALPLLLSPVFAIAFWFTPDATYRAQARQRQREFTRFVTVYLELVAVSLLGQSTADNALAAAADVSDTWVFQRIRREYAYAEITRTSKWDALARLSEAVEVPALGDMARMMRLSEAKVGIRDQLRAACDKLRRQVATDDAQAATKVTGRMQVPVFLLLLPIFALVTIPALAQLVTF
ncbi:hypothetical protein ITJ57_18715 [Plantibacter sp. VKM Ac-2880]|uniref:hypothetical protein n=1 Tax=Plantibacter sp. VKM Ac-2880 TaxID=2783827 RepID=UPI0018902080|nr:hypothetical protein [Plantibacter sp. VKM Ac-2880]MBF4570806.1 hypothetical protein [Plantibacter sp. VKM Ac-2880]